MVFILHGVYISELIRFASICTNVSDSNNINHFLTAKLLKHHKFRKTFSKFYTRHSDLIVKYNVENGLNSPTTKHSTSSILWSLKFINSIESLERK